MKAEKKQIMIFVLLTLFLASAGLCDIAQKTNSQPTVDNNNAARPTTQNPLAPKPSYESINNKSVNTGKLFFKMIGSLALVIVMAIGTFYLSKKTIGKMSSTQAKDIKILETAYLSKGRQLYIVKSLGKKLLIAASAEGITKLTELSDLSEPN